MYSILKNIVSFLVVKNVPVLKNLEEGWQEKR
jgi:hypothetical protein